MDLAEHGDAVGLEEFENALHGNPGFFQRVAVARWVCFQASLSVAPRGRIESNRADQLPSGRSGGRILPGSTAKGLADADHFSMIRTPSMLRADRDRRPPGIEGCSPCSAAFRPNSSPAAPGFCSMSSMEL